MGWVSKKVYAILSSDEEGKKILEGIGEKDQDTVDKEVDAFFNKTGQSNPDKGKQSANPKKEEQPKGKEPDQPKQEQAKASETKYYRHPDVDGIWHDTGKTFERNGEIYKEFENEEGRTWGVSERFSKQFEEAEEPKHPFKLNKEQYPDVETTQYGFIYNVGNSSITDLAAQEKTWGRSDDDIERGFSVTKDGEEFYYDTFDEAYKAAKGSDNDGIPSQTEAEISEALMDYSWQIGESDTVGSFAESIAEKTGYSKDDVLKVIRSDNPNISESDSMAKVAGLGDVENDEDFERSWGPKEDEEESKAGDSDYESSVQFLKEKGYTDEQARGMVKGLIEDTEESDIDPTPEYIENYTKTFYNDGGFKEPDQSESINIPYHDGIKGKIVSEENGVVKVEYETKDGITRTDQFYREEIDKANPSAQVGGKYDAQVTDDDISEHLGDFEWQVDDEMTAGQYAQECADRLGVSKERVFDIIKQQAPDQIKESSNMRRIIDAWEGDYEYKDDGEDPRIMPDEEMAKYEREFPNMGQSEKSLLKALYMKGMLK